jgi:hypothetical protein
VHGWVWGNGCGSRSASVSASRSVSASGSRSVSASGSGNGCMPWAQISVVEM